MRHSPIEARSKVSPTYKDSICESVQPLTFPHGLIGFPDTHHYALIIPPPHISTLNCSILRSLDTSDLCFIVMPIEINDMFFKQTDLNTAFDDLSITTEHARVLLIATPQRQNDQSINIQVNLRAPLIVDTYNQQGWQYVFHNQDYPLQYTLEQPSVLV